MKQRWGPAFSCYLNNSVRLSGTCINPQFCQEHEKAQLKAAHKIISRDASAQSESAQSERILVHAAAKAAGDLKLRMAARAAEMCARAAVAAAMSVNEKMAIFEAADAAAKAAGQVVEDDLRRRFSKLISSKASGLIESRFSDEAKRMTQEMSGQGVPPLVLSEIRNCVSRFQHKAAKVLSESASLDTLGQSSKQAAKAARRAVMDTAQHAKLLLSMADHMINPGPDVSAFNEAADLSEQVALAEDAAAAAIAAAKSAMTAAKAAQKEALKAVGTGDSQQTLPDNWPKTQGCSTIVAEAALFTTKAAGSIAEHASIMAQSASIRARLQIGRFKDFAEFFKTVGECSRELAAGVTTMAVAEAKRAGLLSLLAFGEGLGKAA